jgi:heme exporter protein B
VLDQLSLRGMSGEEIALAKIVGHWLTFGPLLLLASLLGAALLGLDGGALGRTLLTLAIGTPALAALAVTVASLTAGLRSSAALGGLLLLPLAVPLLIFGASAAGSGEPGGLKLEAAVALFILLGAPFVSGAALRALRT